MAIRKTKEMMQQKAATIQDRLDGLQHALQNIVSGVNNQFNQVNTNLDSLALLVEAVVNMMGQEKVLEAMQVLQNKRKEAEMEKAKVMIAEDLASGQIKAVETVTEASLVVGMFQDGNGTVLGVGRDQLVMSAVKPEVQVLFLGASTGTKVALPDGTQFVVAEIYEAMPVSVKEFGALVDGTTDDSAAAQAALDASQVEAVNG